MGSILHKKMNFRLVKVVKEEYEDSWQEYDEKNAVYPNDSEDLVNRIKEEWQSELIAQKKGEVLNVWL